LIRLKTVLHNIGKEEELNEFKKRYNKIIDELKSKLLGQEEIKDNLRPYIIESLTDFYIINDNWTALKENLLQHHNPNIVFKTAKDLILMYGKICRDYKYPSSVSYRDCTKAISLKLKTILKKHSKELKECIHKFKNSKDESIKRKYDSVVSTLKYSELK